MLQDLSKAGELCKIPFLDHADAEPATCLLFIMACLPSPVAVPAKSPVLRALTRRLTAQGSEARLDMLSQILTTVCKLFQVGILPIITSSAHAILPLW